MICVWAVVNRLRLEQHAQIHCLVSQGLYLTHCEEKRRETCTKFAQAHLVCKCRNLENNSCNINRKNTMHLTMVRKSDLGLLLTGNFKAPPALFWKFIAFKPVLDQFAFHIKGSLETEDDGWQPSKQRTVICKTGLRPPWINLYSQPGSNIYELCVETGLWDRTPNSWLYSP